MKLADYEAIRAHLVSLPCNDFPDMDALKAQYPGVSLDALVSIYSQESSRRIKANHGRHVRSIEAHARRYLAGEDIFAIADAVDLRGGHRVCILQSRRTEPTLFAMLQLQNLAWCSPPPGVA